MDLELFVAQRGVEIVEGHLPNGQWGEWDCESRTITLLPGLGPTQYRTTLAHEAGHMMHGHRESTAETEREADEYAIWLLFGPCMFLRAAQGAEHIETVAAELGVMPELAAYALKRGRRVLKKRRALGQSWRC